MKNGSAWLVATASGLTLWTLANLAGGSQEPWDQELYWTLWLPLAAAVCVALGFAFPERPVRWPFAVMLSQPLVMLAFTGEIGAFLLIGVGLLLVMAVLAMPFSALGALLRRRFAT